MSRTPSANKNLVKATQIRKSGAKSYIHSVTDENGHQYYATAINKWFAEGKTIKAIMKLLVDTYPAVEPPSMTALQNYCRKYALVTVPAGTFDVNKRPDAIAVMYEMLAVMQAEMKKADDMYGKTPIPVPVVRSVARDVIFAAEKIAIAEKAVGIQPPSVINLHGDITNNTQNVTNVQQIAIVEPEKGKELMARFAAFQGEVLNYQQEAATSAPAQS
jgi:hypothetical protein